MQQNILIVPPRGKIRETYFPQELLDRLRKIGVVIENDSSEKFSQKEFAEIIKDIDICVTHWDSPCFDKKVLKNAHRLKLIAHAAGSVAKFITDDVYKKGITVCSANKLMAKYVAESVLSYTLSALKRIPAYDSAMKRGELWPEAGGYNSLFDSKIGLVGLGTVGSYFIDLLKPFTAEIRIYDPYVSEDFFSQHDNICVCELDEVLRWADIVSLHAAKTPETYHMIDEEKLSLIKNGALLVNTARGAVIDEQALTNELVSGRISAVLDVYEEEPLPIDSRLRGLENVILLPHKAAAPCREQMTIVMIDEIERFLRGRDLEYTIPYEKFTLMTR
jgi:phosphoglycerate dehydrogenase-like enzyme